jgi:site-specific recombinase XerD
MFDTLFTHPLILDRHRTAPCQETREAFLVHCAEQGYPYASLKKIAWILLVFSQSIDLCRPSRITAKEIEFAVDHRIRYLQRPEGSTESRSSRLLFIHIATAWLRFCGYVVVKEHAAVTAFDEYIEKFTKFMRDERGLSKATITFNCEQLMNFLIFTGPDKVSLNDISIHDIDAYIVHQGNHGWKRRSLHTLAGALRAFFRYAETQHWVKEIATAIEAPHVYAQETLPLGPTWEEVKQLINSFSSDSAADLRARAIVLLLAVYGLRRGEVAGLRLEDVDWVGEILHITRPKQRCTQQYPLDQTVGDAILRYIQEARSCCAYRQIFLTLDAPIRPLLPACISYIVRARLKYLGIDAQKKGSHCLRHACARHLLDAGFSLKQIGDQLGHRSSSATREYVKVDLNGLRQVAELDLGDLL